MEYKIKIEEKFNPGNSKVGQWFVKYDRSIDEPIFTENENKAGIFVSNFNADNSLHGNMMALYDRFGYKGTSVKYLENQNKIN